MVPARVRGRLSLGPSRHRGDRLHRPGRRRHGEGSDRRGRPALQRIPPRQSVRRFVFAARLVLAARAVPLAAQVVDTTRADSLARDTTDYTALYLKGIQESRRLVPVAPRIGAAALLPPRTRLVLDRDSILWHNAEAGTHLR